MKHGTHQINSFFVEIILVILFFAISVTVTLQLFVVANNRARESRDLSTAVIKAEDIAEQVKGLSAPDALPVALANAKQTGADGGAQHYRLTFDGQWNETQTDPSYIIEVTLKKSPAKSGTLVNADITVTRDKQNKEEQLLTLNSAKYLPGSA